MFAHTPRGDRVLLTGTTAKVRVIPTGTNVAGFSRFTGTGSAFSVSPDRGFIALVDEKEGRITVFDTDVGEQKANWEFSGEDFTQVVFTLNGQHIITKSRVNHTGGMYLLRILNVKTGQVVTSIERDNPRKKFPDDWPDSYRNDDVYNSIVVSPDGETLAIPRLVEHQEEPDSTDVTSEVQLWDVKSGQLQITLTDFNTPIISMAFSHDSTQLVTVTTSAIVQLWETRMGRLVKTIGKNVSAEYAMFSPNAKKMILVGNEMQLWDTEVWRQIGRFPRAAWARFSPDFRRIVSSTERKSPLGGYSTISSNPTTWLWDAADGRLVATLLGRTVLNWHFTLDSKGLITEHQGGQIRLWNIEDGSLIYVLPPEENLSVTDISTDGQLFIARSGGRTKIWDLQKGRLLASHDENMGMKDLACGALFGSYIDRIFTFSSHPHDGSPRFNADSSRLITNRGLRNVNSETRSPEVVSRWIEAHVPLRLADGRFRPATPEEMYLAELNFHLHTLGQEHPETLGSELRYKGYLVGQCVRTGKMEEASDLIDIMQSWLSQKDTHLIREAKDVFKQLAKMYFERGLTGRRNEKYTEAIAAYEEAVRLNPKYALAFNNLAWLQATCPEAEFRNGTKAVEFATKACELTDWKEWNYLDTLAAAYAEAGNFSAAAKWQQKAIDLQTDGNQTETQTGMETRLKLYQSGQPYRQ